MSKTVGPPDVSGSVGAKWRDSTTLFNFPYETWVTLEVTGTVAFTSLAPASGASGFYQYPGRSDVPATGLYDGRQDTGCVMNLTVTGELVNGGNFGLCGGAQQINKFKIVGSNAKVRRGPPPYQNSYDCDPWGNAICHSVSGSQSVRLRPVPVALKANASPNVVNFTTTTTQVTFTGFMSPATLMVQGGAQPFTFAVTSWQWISATDTVTTIVSAPTCLFPSGAAATRNCIFTPQTSGRMILSGFAGGYQQTASASVQCFFGPPDFIVNDTANDFSARAELLDALGLSNPDSTATAGWDASNPKGWRNEAPGVLWQLPNGGGYQFVPYDNPSGNPCKSDLPPSEWAPGKEPVPGAVPVAGVHSHSSLPGGQLFGCDSAYDAKSIMRGGAQFPGDVDENGIPRPVGRQNFEDETHPAGSTFDWQWVDSNGLPLFIMTARGYALRLENPMNGKLRGPYKAWRATRGIARDDSTAHKCAWVKKYKG